MLLVAPVMLPAVITVRQTAQAADECGAGTTIVCQPSGNPFATGITYQPTADFNLSFAPGTVVQTSVANGLTVETLGSGSTLILDTSQGSITATGGFSGISASNFSGVTNITTGNVTAGSAANDFLSAPAITIFDNEIYLDTRPGQIISFGESSPAIDITAVTQASLFTSDVITHGDNSPGIRSLSAGLSIDTTAGTVLTSGRSSPGVQASSFFGSSVTVATGDISTTGPRSSGVEVNSFDTPIQIDATGGLTNTTGESSAGIVAADFRSASPLSVTSGHITTSGSAAPGIATFGGGPVTINSTGGSILTSGTGSAGIFAFASLSDSALDIRSGQISTTGTGAYGIAAAARSQVVIDCSSGTCLPIFGPSGSISIQNNSPITATGSESGGVVAVSFAPNGLASGSVTVAANSNIIALGQRSVGIAAASGSGTVQVEVAPNVSVMGGWSDTALSTQGSFFLVPSSIATDTTASVGSNLPAAGIVVYSGATGSTPAMTILNQGFVNALNDQAVTMGFACASENGPGALPQQNPCFSGMPPIQTLQVLNQNTVTGYVNFLAGAPHVFDNAGLFDVRNFADIDGDGARDMKRVSISDFGGPDATFNNMSSGSVSLAPVIGATNVDPTNYYVPTTGIDSQPLEASFYDLRREGVVQGQFTNLATFNNQGDIDLRGPAIGNTLVITGGPGFVGGVLQPGSGTFVTGGNLLVNTVLNAGLPAGGITNSYSDMLVVDSTRVGATGSTRVFVTYGAGGGEETLGNGIQIVEVRNKTASSDGAFALGDRVASGAYEYQLYRNGVGADYADGNWYLRSTLILPGPPAPEPEVPDYRPEVPTDTVLPVLAHRLGLDTLGTYRDRFGEDYPDPVAPTETVFCKDPTQNYRCTPTPEQAAVYADGRVSRGGAAWGRFFGETGSADFGKGTMREALNGLLDHGPSYDFHIWGIQTGMDLLRRQNENNSRDIAGVYFGYARGTADVSGVYGGVSGSSDMNAYSLGGYWTHFGARGWYVDAVLQGTRYDQAEASSILGENFETSGWGVAASLEGGYPVALGSDWTLEPSAQLVYQHVSLGNGRDRFGLIGFDDSDAIYGRLGGRLAHDWTTQAGRRITGWAAVNVWSSFGASADTTFSNLSGGNSVTFGADLGGTWGSFGLGLSAELAKNVRMFATGDYSVGLAGGDSWSFGGRTGLKVTW